MKLIIALLALLTLSACSSLTVGQQHMIAKRNHHYISDQAQYGLTDAWKASLTGDCEDYALWMRDRVGGDLVYVRTQQGEPHMVLIVNGVFDDKKPVSGLVVDNLSQVVYPVSQMKHKFVYTLSDKNISDYLKHAPAPEAR